MTNQDLFYVLIADNDQTTCKTLANYLTNNGIKSAIAQNSEEAFEMVSEIKPHLIIVDLCLPGMDGITFMGEIKKKYSTISVIIVAKKADIKTAVQAVKNGAVDFIEKPLNQDELLLKIQSIASSPELIAIPGIHNEFNSLYDVVNKITATHDLETLLTIIFDSAMSLTSATSGVLHLHDKGTNELLNVRSSGDLSYERHICLKHCEIPQVMAAFVFTQGKMAVSIGETYQSGRFSTEITKRTGTWYEVGVPINISGKNVGVLSLVNTGEKGFSSSDLDLVEVIALQAGIALYNADLYSSINQKLDELMLISNYSEKLTGLVDKYDIVNTFCTITMKHFPIDMLGFFIVQKRTHEFLYWTRGVIKEKKIKEISSEVIEVFNSSASMTINEKRVRLRRLLIEEESDSTCTEQFDFRHVIPVCLEDFKFGAFFFGAVKEFPNRSETISLLSSLVNQTRIALTNSKLYSDIKENYIRTIKALAIAVDAKDTYTHGHSENVMSIAEEIARAMNLDEKTIGIIRDAGLLHDIGKIGIPGYILNKPGPLTYEEFNGIMKTHSTLGANIVKDVPFLQDLYSLILYHHEHFDGSGYPEGIKGEKIPLGARILHVADAFEAMASDRPYRSSLGEEEAIKRLIEEQSKQFDPDVVQAFLKISYRKYQSKH